MNIVRQHEVTVLSNSGVRSEQLVFPENMPQANVTVTRVTLPAGGINPRHVHEFSEQIWIVLEGEGRLLLGEGEQAPIQAGDVVRFSAGEWHGFDNTGSGAFVYMSVTSPPLNFRSAYESTWSGHAGKAG